jgi:hypothetical protein
MIAANRSVAPRREVFLKFIRDVFKNRVEICADNGIKFNTPVQDSYQGFVKGKVLTKKKERLNGLRENIE